MTSKMRDHDMIFPMDDNTDKSEALKQYEAIKDVTPYDTEDEPGSSEDEYTEPTYELDDLKVILEQAEYVADAIKTHKELNDWFECADDDIYLAFTDTIMNINESIYIQRGLAWCRKHDIDGAKWKGNWNAFMTQFDTIPHKHMTAKEKFTVSYKIIMNDIPDLVVKLQRIIASKTK